MKFPLFDHLEARLISAVGISMLIFSVAAGLVTYTYGYRQQLASADSLQQQMVAAVQAQAEVAAFAANQQIAEGVISGLVTNPVIMAARIESTTGFSTELGYREKAGQGTQKAYPLLSPVDHLEPIGILTVVQNDAYVQRTAFKAASFQTLLLLGQILIAVVIMTIVLRSLMIRPITQVAKDLAAIVPGSPARVPLDSDHRSDEIGQMARSANGLLEATEQAIAEERSLRTLLEATGRIAKIGGWSLDVESKVLNWTTETYRIHELDPAESVDLARAINFLVPEARALALDAVKQCIEHGVPFDLELPLISAQGNHRWVRAQGNAMRSDGRITGMYGALQDISERKLAEAELVAAKTNAEKANRTKSQFLAAASHDLRQPMQAIGLFNDALGRTALNEEQQRMSDYLSQSVNSLADLLNVLLDISKLDAGAIKASTAAMAADVLAARIDGGFSPLAAKRSLRFKLCFPQREMLLLTDDKLIMSLLGNLVSNAIKYTEKGGVLVAMRRRKDHALVQVWDTGIGIAPEHLGSVFDEYFQVGNAERDRTKGLGLGLAIARRLAMLLNTEVGCRSRLGKGSVFEFRLPLAPRASRVELSTAHPETSEPETHQPLAGWHIAVIEDDAMAAKALQMSLEHLRATVTRFASAEDALADAAIGEADFYISDFRLPGLSGAELLDQISQRAKRPIKGLVLTGDTSAARIAMAESSRWPVLFKPVNLPRLLAAIKMHGATAS